MLKKLTNIFLALFLTISSITYVNVVKAESGYSLSARQSLTNLFDNMDDMFGVGNSGHSVGFMTASLPNGTTTGV